MTSVFPGFKRHRHEIELGVMCHPSLRQIIRQSPKSIAMRTFSFLLSSPLNSFLILGKYQAFGVFDQVVFFENRKCQVKSQEVKQSGTAQTPVCCLLPLVFAMEELDFDLQASSPNA